MKKKVIVNALLIVLVAVGIAVAFYLGENKSRGASTKQFELTEPVKAGHSLKGKYREVNRPNDASVIPDELVTDSELLDKSIATIDLYKKSDLTKSNITQEKSLDRNFVFAMPVTVQGAVANSLAIGDKVAIKVEYKDANMPTEVVVPAIHIRDIKTSNGAPLTDETTVPGNLIFDTTNEENSDLSSASKLGTLYVVKYKNMGQKELLKTYTAGGTQSQSAEKRDKKDK